MSTKHTPDYAALRCAAESFAPTALAALDDLIRVVRRLVDACDCEAYGIDPRTCDHAKARAAIAKAKGEG